MGRLILGFVVIASVFSSSAMAQEIQGHFRARPPEMTIEGGKFSGPIKDVIEEAVHTVGLTIVWSDVPFARSLKQLQEGAPILVPRFNRTADREAYSLLLGPIAVQKRRIMFAVRRSGDAIGWRETRNRVFRRFR